MKTGCTSRETNLEHSHTLWHSAFPDREFLSYLLFLIFPALICGCTAPELAQTYPDAPESNRVKTIIKMNSQALCLDVFTFENDRMERLDSYQRIDKDLHGDKLCSIASRAGEKTVVIIANSHADKYEWIDINSRKALQKKTFDLEDEDPENLMLIGEYKTTAGKAFQAILTPMTAEIVLRSIRCDFAGLPYEGENMTDVKVYLTNINASCGIWTGEETFPTRVINAGRLSEHDMAGFRHPEMVVQEIDSDIGAECIYPDIRLRAYPNSSPEESAGSPYTKLVVEGKIDGHTYYYPISINRGNEKKGSGIRRNKRYIYDLTITRTGLEDPDGTIEDTEHKIIMEIKEWKEKDWYDIRF